ncbi:hypothetical protein V6N12_043122 [Hibiscus sabdariffa]|uniref:Uncharacterized protein n=1 Tax=Hibiscus sabdariffa TaxID=183260 RepID=A0ABR2DL71_9ROSI
MLSTRLNSEPRESSPVAPAAPSVDPVTSDLMVDSGSIACSSDSILGSREEEHAVGDIDNTGDSVEIHAVEVAAEVATDPVISDVEAIEEGTSVVVIPFVSTRGDEVDSTVAPSSICSSQKQIERHVSFIVGRKKSGVNVRSGLE